MSIHYKVQDNFIMVFGKTYPHRQAIRDLGGRFLGQQKVWQIKLSDDALKQIELLAKATGGANLKVAPGELTPKEKAPAPPPKPDASFLNHYIGKIEKGPQPASAGDKQAFSLSELMLQLSGVLQRAFAKPIWVKAEVQNFNNRGRGIFLSLAEGVSGANEAATTTINATIWSNQLERMYSKHGRKAVEDVLKDGMEIRALCQVNLYKGRGNISLQIQDIDPDFTKGNLALAREKLLRELRQKGLDKANKALHLPVLPLKIGLISAAGSRAESDFLHQLMVGNFPGRVVFIPTPMQGESVPQKVCDAIDKLTSIHVDAIVLTRGGGSAADLRWFDAPEIAFKIAQAQIPILSAIGHHDDYCVAEEISYRREKTPTAMAEFFLGCLAEYVERARSASNRLSLVAERRIHHESQRHIHLSQSILEASRTNIHRRETYLQQRSGKLIGFAQAATHQLETTIRQSANKLVRAAEQIIESRSTHLMRWKEQLLLKANHAIDIQNDKLNRLDKFLTSKDPKPWLERGWTQIFSTKKPNEPLKSIHDVHAEDELEARLLDGVLHLKKNTNKGINNE